MNAANVLVPAEGVPEANANAMPPNLAEVVIPPNMGPNPNALGANAAAAAATTVLAAGSTGSPAAAAEEDTYVTKPGDDDVLCGRGGATNNHKGNVRYRALVRSSQDEYLCAIKSEKKEIARQIVSTIRGRGGMFLKKCTDRSGWVDVGDKKAREKTSQALREGLDAKTLLAKGIVKSDVVVGSIAASVSVPSADATSTVTGKRKTPVGSAGAAGTTTSKKKKDPEGSLAEAAAAAVKAAAAAAAAATAAVNTPDDNKAAAFTTATGNSPPIDDKVATAPAPAPELVAESAPTAPANAPTAAPSGNPPAPSYYDYSSAFAALAASTSGTGGAYPYGSSGYAGFPGAQFTGYGGGYYGYPGSFAGGGSYGIGSASASAATTGVGGGYESAGGGNLYDYAAAANAFGIPPPPVAAKDDNDDDGSIGNTAQV